MSNIREKSQGNEAGTKVESKAKEASRELKKVRRPLTYHFMFCLPVKEEKKKEN